MNHNDYESSEFARMDEENPLMPPPSERDLVAEDGCELSDDEFNEILESQCASCPCLQ